MEGGAALKHGTMFGKEEVEIVSELPGLTIVKFKDGHIAGVNPEELIESVKAEEKEKKPKAKKADKSGA